MLYTLPPMAPPASMTKAGPAELVGYALMLSKAAPGEIINLALFWRTLRLPYGPIFSTSPTPASMKSSP